MVSYTHTLSLWCNKLSGSWIQRSLILTLALFFGLGTFSCYAGTVTLSTYYPSPSGEYVDLQTDKLAVGDITIIVFASAFPAVR